MPESGNCGRAIRAPDYEHARAMVELPGAGTPRTRDGNPNLAARAPRAPNGKPDLSGCGRPSTHRPARYERLFGESLRILWFRETTHAPSRSTS